MFGFGLMLLLTACSNKHAEWQHPDKLKDTWHADRLKCKNFAKTQLARQIDIENDANLFVYGEWFKHYRKESVIVGSSQLPRKRAPNPPANIPIGKITRSAANPSCPVTHRRGEITSQVVKPRLM